MRGKVLRNRDCTALIGITPAYAGKRIRRAEGMYAGVWITPAYAGKSASQF